MRVETIGACELWHGDMLQVLPTLAADSFHSCICDPPYHLTSIVKRFGADNAAPAKEGKTGAYKRASAGFMGKKWDGGDIAFRPETWAEVLRVLRPGAHLAAFGGTRTFHRMMCAIEVAGFELRDTLCWLYGSGFPKSHDIGKNVEEFLGWGTALKPAWEPISLFRKPLERGLTVAANVLKWGTGAINVDACRVGLTGSFDDPRLGGNGSWNNRRIPDGATVSLPAATLTSSPLGRWPANVVHDGSGEVLAAFPDSDGQQGFVGAKHGARPSINTYGDYGARQDTPPRNDVGSAARFFYSAKADAEDRQGSRHPTVKPVDLMRWLVRLTTPQGGTTLDCFAGSGSTGEAAIREGVGCTLIEMTEEYIPDIRRRLIAAQKQPDLFLVPPVAQVSA